MSHISNFAHNLPGYFASLFRLRNTNKDRRKEKESKRLQRRCYFKREQTIISSKVGKLTRPVEWWIFLFTHSLKITKTMSDLDRIGGILESCLRSSNLHYIPKIDLTWLNTVKLHRMVVRHTVNSSCKLSIWSVNLTKVTRNVTKWCVL